MRTVVQFSLLPLLVCAQMAIGYAEPSSASTPIPVFGPDMTVSPAGRHAAAPDVAVDRAGKVHLLWLDKGPMLPPAPPGPPGSHGHSAADNLFYMGITAAGARDDAPVRVNSVDGEVWGFAVSKPILDVAADGTLHVLFPGNATREGTGQGLLVARYTRSVDGGKSFTQARTLNSPARNDLSAVMHGGFAAAHAFGTLVSNGSDVQVFWVDTRTMGEDNLEAGVRVASSHDGGESFLADREIWPGEVCPCCQLVAAARQDEVVLTSRRAYPEGFRDSTIAVSQDRGASFGERVRLGEGRWEIDGCPLKPTVVAMGSNTLYAAWFTAGQEPAGVYFARSIDDGKSYQHSMLMHADAAVSDAPAIAVDSNQLVYVAWHAKAGDLRRVYLRVSADEGASFGPAIEVPAAPGTAANPDLAAGPDGRVYLVWEQDQAVHLMSIESGVERVADAASL